MSVELREGLHGMWASVAPAWGAHADYVDLRAAALSERMLSLAELAEGERVLELACGAGGLGLAAAERLGPTGEVVLSDVVPEMAAIAAERAAAAGMRNITTRVLDLEQIEEPDQSYDVVVCREGLMFTLEPARAASEIRRILRPGGRAVIAVWGPRTENPWLSLVLEAVSAQLGAPVPPPGIPGPFSLEDVDQLRSALVQGGLRDVAIEEFAVSTRAESVEDWWDRTSALAGPLANILARLPEDAARTLRARADEAVAPYRVHEGLEFPGLALIATARAVDEALNGV